MNDGAFNTPKLSNFRKNSKVVTMQQREQIIQQYIESYNNFDVEGMLTNLDENIQFENISGGETNMSIKGLAAFKEQAEKAKALFSERQQVIKDFWHEKNQTEIDIDYHAILAIDLPNGLKTGDALDLKGKSVFIFDGSTIIAITDIS
jgi:uncharacterized protein YfcZ (UPF0381/DUF406 family)